MHPGSIQLASPDADANGALEASFDVIDVLGLSSLERASATLDGSIPLRAAQACSPLLDGNRFGFQVKLAERLRLERRLGRIRAIIPELRRRTHAGSFPRLIAEGLLARDGEWARKLARSPIVAESKKRVLLFTGLLVRPRPGTWLRVGNAGNRRNQSFCVEERWFAAVERFAPLVLELAIEPGTEFPLDLSGEIATLAPFRPDVGCDRVDIEHEKELGRAHANFYDAAYFREKKRGPTQKYKKLVARSSAPESTSSRGTLTIVDAGENAFSIETRKTFVTHAGIEVREAPALPCCTFANTIALTARFDGHDTFVEPDARALAGHARAVETRWTNALGRELAHGSRGAIWYFSKYVTPHQAGEPYFFVKPPALFRTNPGWSLLVEGIPGPGYDVLRGVIASDVFHAAPAVIRLNHPGRAIEARAGTPLARLIAFPRALLASRFEMTPFR